MLSGGYTADEIWLTGGGGAGTRAGAPLVEPDSGKQRGSSVPDICVPVCGRRRGAGAPRWPPPLHGGALWRYGGESQPHGLLGRKSVMLSWAKKKLRIQRTYLLNRASFLLEVQNFALLSIFICQRFFSLSSI